MPDSLLFDGVDDRINFSAGTFAGSGASTYAIACKVAADEAAFRTLWCDNTAIEAVTFSNASPAKATYYPGSGGSVDNSTFTIPASDGWVILAYSRPGTGFDVGRWHKYVFSTDTWTHTAADGPGLVNSAACTAIRFGAHADNGQAWDGNVLIAAAWDSELSDGTIETLEPGTAAWVAAAPDECWRFDTTSSISSLTGTSTESSRTGTTLDSGDAPTGWEDLAGPVVAWITA